MKGAWDSYFERFQNWCEINGIQEEKRTRALLSVVGEQTYEVIKALLGEKDPFKVKVEEINQNLMSHYNPKALIIGERYRFWTTSQEEGESIKDYSLRLQKLSSTCAFDDFLDDALRDRFIVGLRDDQKNIRPSLLTEENLSFESACERELRIYMASAESKDISKEQYEVLKVTNTTRLQRSIWHVIFMVKRGISRLIVV